MKSIYIILVAAILLLPTSALYAQISKAEIVATGLTCSMCSNAINKQLKKISAVDKVETDLNSNTFTIYFKKDNNISPKILKDNIQKAGFFVGSMIITLNFDHQKIYDNIKITKNDVFYNIIDTKQKMLDGDTKLKVMDKGYVVMKDFNKFKKAYAKYETFAADNENDFHLKPL